MSPDHMSPFNREPDISMLVRLQFNPAQYGYVSYRPPVIEMPVGGQLIGLYGKPIYTMDNPFVLVRETFTPRRDQSLFFKYTPEMESETALARDRFLTGLASKVYSLSHEPILMILPRKHKISASQIQTYQ